MSNPDKALRSVRNAYRLVHIYQSALLQIIRKIERSLEVTLEDWNGPSEDTAEHRSLSADATTYLPFIYTDFNFSTNKFTGKLQEDDFAVYVVHSADTSLINKRDGIVDLLDEPNKASPENEGKTILTVSMMVSKSRNEEHSWYDVWNIDFAEKLTPFSGGDLGNDAGHKSYGWHLINDRRNDEYIFDENKSQIEKDLKLDARMKKVHMEDMTDNTAINAFIDRLVQLKEEMLSSQKST